MKAKWFSLPVVARKAKLVLKFATNVIPKLPTLDDPLITQVVKALGILDTLTEGTKEDIYSFLQGLHGFEAVTNPFFADLILRTPLSTFFNVVRRPMSDHVTLVAIEKEGLGQIFFVEWRYGGAPQIDATFWHSPGFDFDACLNLLWEVYSDHILLGLEVDRNTRTKKLSCEDNPTSVDPILGRARERLDRMVRKHHRYQQDNVARTYLLLGSWGTGKTTFAQAMAKEIGGRSLTIDANGFTSLSSSDLGLILTGMHPQVLIIDDLDRAPDLAAVLPTLFISLRALRQAHPDIVVFLTANLVEKIDPALNRPERIDEIEVFELPNDTERRAILDGYLALQEVVVDETSLRELVEATAGLSEVFLKEAALQLHYEPPAEVIARVLQRKKLAGVGVAAKAEKSETPPTS